MKRARLASLDAVRAFACLAVLAYHMHLVGFGHISLALFFMLGGFLSAYNSYGRSDTQNVTLKSCVGYSRDKIMKLYPLHIAALLIPLAGQIYGAVHKLISAKLVAFKLAANLVLLQSWIPLNDIYFSLNAPAWYLSTIAFSYFMFPWLLKGLEKLRSARALFGAGCVIWLAQIAIGFVGEGLYALAARPDWITARSFTDWFTFIFPVFRFGDFAVGACLACVFIKQRDKDASSLAWTAAELAAIALWVLTELGFERGVLPVNESSAFIPTTAGIIYVFAVNKGYISRFLTNKVTKFIAGISAEVFLTHEVVIFVCSPIITSLPISGGAQKAVYIIAVPILSYIASLAGRKLNAVFARRTSRVKAGTA